VLARATAYALLPALLALAAPATVRAEGTDADIAIMNRWTAENRAFKSDMKSKTFAGWWDGVHQSAFGTRTMMPIVRDIKLLRNVLIQLRTSHPDRFTPRQLRVLDRKIADLDRRSQRGSSPAETGIPAAFLPRIPAYPGTTASWRGVKPKPPAPRGLARVTGMASRALRSATSRVRPQQRPDARTQTARTTRAAARAR
jgi:hypothetical protein